MYGYFPELTKSLILVHLDEVETAKDSFRNIGLEIGMGICFFRTCLRRRGRVDG